MPGVGGVRVDRGVLLEQLEIWTRSSTIAELVVLEVAASQKQIREQISRSALVAVRQMIRQGMMLFDRRSAKRA